MKRLMMTCAGVLALSGAAQAENNEQQVYYPPYITNSGLTQQDLVNRQNYIIAQQQARLQGQYHVVRDPTASYQPGKIPDHPGDYRDAFDRGLLPNLGTSYKQDIPIGR